MPVSAFIARGVTYAVSLTRLSGTGFLPAPGLDPPLGIFLSFLLTQRYVKYFDFATLLIKILKNFSKKNYGPRIAAGAV